MYKLTLFEAYFHIITWKNGINLSRSASRKAFMKFILRNLQKVLGTYSAISGVPIFTCAEERPRSVGTVCIASAIVNIKGTLIKICSRKT